MEKIDVIALKDFIRGKEFELAERLVGLTEGKDKKEHHQPCPLCAGTDRFRYNPEKRTFHCRQCRFNGDLIALIEKIRCVSFAEALSVIALESGFESLHIRHAVSALTKSIQEGKPIPLDTFRLDPDSPVYKATAAHRPDILFEDYQRAGAKLFRNGIAIPMFDNGGIVSGYVRYFETGGKPKLTGKSGIVGTDAIYNLRTAKEAKIIFKTAGVSDYLVLSGIIERLGLESDYYAFTNGAGESELPDKFEPLLKPALQGKNVGVVQDNDEAGRAGALRWAESIAEFAADVRIITLPPVVFDCNVKDLRDFFAIDGTTFLDLDFVKGNSLKGGCNGIH